MHSLEVSPESTQSPPFRFRDEAWKLFLELGREHGMSPSEVAKQVAAALEEIANIEKEGGIVIAKKADNKVIRIKIFGNHRDGNTNNSST